MIRRLLAVAFSLACLAVALPAVALPSLGGASSHTPVLQSATVYFGAMTRSGQGGVPLTNLLKVPGSPPVAGWLITQTKGTAAYFSLSTSKTYVPEWSQLATPTWGTAGLANLGTGYAVGDQITLNNGAVLNVGSVSAGQVLSTTLVTKPTSNIVGPAAVTQTSTTGAGTGVRFTFQYAQQGQTPTPTTTGANNDLDGNLTTADAFEWQVQAVGADGTLSNTVKLQYDLVADAVNWSGTGSLTASTVFGSCTIVSGHCNGTSSTSGLAAFVAAAYSSGFGNCSATTHACDIALLFSTGANYANPNTGPRIPAPASQYSDQPIIVTVANLNAGGAITAAGDTPQYSNALTIWDACRAGATPVAAYLGASSSLPVCDGTHGQPNVYDSPRFAGTNQSMGNPASSSDVCYLGSSTVGFTWVKIEGLTLGGAPLVNYSSAAPFAFDVVKTCSVFVEYTLASYAYGLDQGPFSAYLAGGNISAAIDLDQYNDHLQINFTTCLHTSYCIEDYSSSSTNGSQDVMISHLWARGFNQNALTAANGNPVTYQDAYVIGPEQYPFSGAHIDAFQNLDQKSGVTVCNRCYLLMAEGNASHQGFFMGNNAGVAAAPSLALNGLVMFANSAQFIKAQSLNGHVQPSAFQHVTSLRQAPIYPGANSANGYQGMTWSANPTDGDSITIGSGCTPYPANGQTGGCSQAYTTTLTFRNSPAASTDIQIGASLAATQANLENALGVSVDNIGCSAVVNASGTATSRTALSLLAHTCLHSSATQVISDWPGPALVFQTLASSGHVSFVGPNMNVIGADNILNTAGPGATLYNLATAAGHSGDATVDTTCTTTGVHYCGTVSFDSVYMDGAFDDVTGAHSCYTVTCMRSVVPSAVFTITNNVVSGGVNPTCWPAVGSCANHPYNKFAGDSSTNTAETQAEAIAPATWRAMSPYQVCQTYAGFVWPKAGGDLDPNGNQSTAIGAFTFAHVWNDGSGLAPCYDLGTGVAYASNPWPH